MEKKKMKIWKKILIIMLILFCILVVFMSRRFIILADIDKKVTECENENKNIYIKTSYNFENYKSEIQRFIKDDVDKMVMEKTDKDGEIVKMMQITYPTQRKMFTESKDSKVMYVYEEEAAVRGAHLEMNDDVTMSYTTILNFGYSMSISERIILAMITSIKTVNMDGKECYELSNVNNSNMLMDTGYVKMKAYVEKETGLPVKVIQETKENGEIKQDITTYEYSFGKVTDEDMKEPDATQYKMQE